MHLLLELLLLSSLLSLEGIALAYVAASPRTVFRRFPGPVRTTAQVYNDLGISTYALPSGTPMRVLNSTITAAATGYPESCPGCCLVGHPLPCTGSKTWDGPPLSLAEQCILWNSSCKGNADSAAQNFFYNAVMLDEKPCWRSSANVSLRCTEYEPAETLAAMSAIKDWMRNSKCMSKSISHIGPTTTTLTAAAATKVITTSMTTVSGETCCGLPIIEAQNVDVYYWPEPEANTACLSVVGDSVNPLFYGATTDSGSVYWGCTAKNPKASIATSFIAWDTGTVLTNVQSIITTAKITSINSVTFRYPLLNPWSPPECIGVATSSQTSSNSVNNTSRTIHARGHSIVIPTSVIQDGGLPVSTVEFGSFTFTSPSIYANFHSITAADGCGALGSETIVTQTMLTFSPGELSTIAGPFYNPWGSMYRNVSTKVFNFADLPCPPQDVMEENWYKPAPGEPYRPLIALPDKVKEIDPAWSGCSNAFFTGFDPPRTLVPTGAMVPDKTPSFSVTNSATATPSPTPSVGPKKTASGDNMKTSVPKTVEDQTNKPMKTSPNSQQKGFGSESQHRSVSKAREGYATIVTSDLNQQSSDGEDPRATLQKAEQISPIPSVTSVGPETSGQTSQLVLTPSHDLPKKSAMSGDPDTYNLQAASQVEVQQTRQDTKPFSEDLVQQKTLTVSSKAPSVETEQDDKYPDPSQGQASFAGETVAASSPDLHVQNPSLKDTGIVAGVTSANQGRIVADGTSIIRLSATANSQITTIAGQAMREGMNGVSIHDAFVTAGATPASTSGTRISVDSSNQIYIEGTSHQLPTPSAAPMVTLANGATALAVQDDASIYDTTLALGKLAITTSGNVISVNDIGDLVLIGGNGSNSLSLTIPSSDPPSLDHYSLNVATSSEFTAAASTFAKAAHTLSAGAPAITVNGVAVSLDPTGHLVIGSETLAAGDPSGELGGVIMGGLQSEGPYPTNSVTKVQPSLPTASINGPSTRPTSTSQAKSARNLFSRRLLAALVTASAMCLPFGHCLA